MRFGSWCLLGLALPLFGCIEFDAPLGPPKSPIDPNLLGEWRCMSFGTPDPDVVVRMNVQALEPNHYEVVFPCDQPDHPDCRFRAHITRLHHTPILSAEEMEGGKGSGKWYFVRYTFHRYNLLRFEVADHDALKDVPETSSALRQALGKEMKRHGVFLDYLACAKVEEKVQDDSATESTTSALPTPEPTPSK